MDVTTITSYCTLTAVILLNLFFCLFVAVTASQLESYFHLLIVRGIHSLYQYQKCYNFVSGCSDIEIHYVLPHANSFTCFLEYADKLQEET